MSPLVPSVHFPPFHAGLRVWVDHSQPHRPRAGNAARCIVQSPLFDVGSLDRSAVLLSPVLFRRHNVSIRRQLTLREVSRHALFFVYGAADCNPFLPDSNSEPSLPKYLERGVRHITRLGILKALPISDELGFDSPRSNKSTFPRIFSSRCRLSHLFATTVRF
jgi:hypothetical protein